MELHLTIRNYFEVFYKQKFNEMRYTRKYLFYIFINKITKRAIKKKNYQNFFIIRNGRINCG